MGQSQSALSPSIVVWERHSRSCSQCGVAFGMGCSRHHCRACGDLVCHCCSPYEAYLPQLDYPEDESQRVCTTCASRSHRVVLHEMAVASCLKDQLLSQGYADDATLANVEDLYGKAIAMPAFNCFLLDQLRLLFSSVFAQSYALTLTQLDDALRATYAGQLQLRNCIVACERVRAVYLDHAGIFDPIDVQLLSDQIECARIRSDRKTVPSSASSLRPCLVQKDGLRGRKKNVRILIAIPAMPDFEAVRSEKGADLPFADVSEPPIELNRIANYASDVVCQ